MQLKLIKAGSPLASVCVCVVFEVMTLLAHKQSTLMMHKLAYGSSILQNKLSVPKIIDTNLPNNISSVHTYTSFPR